MSALKVIGTVTPSARGDFTQRMTKFPHVFEEATGEKLVPGTLNIRVSTEIRSKEHFRIHGSRINEPEQDLLFEVCRINGILSVQTPSYTKKG
jgi:hypothetical protein